MTRAQDSQNRSIGIKALVEDGDEQPFRELMADIFAAASIMQALRRQSARRFNLTSTELAVIMAVTKLNDEPSVRRIADHLQVAASNVTADVGKLVHVGLLKKLPDPSDARAIKIGLTTKGANLVRALVPALRGVNDRLFLGMSRPEMLLVTKRLRRIIDEGGKMLLEADPRPD